MINNNLKVPPLLSHSGKCGNQMDSL